MQVDLREFCQKSYIVRYRYNTIHHNTALNTAINNTALISAIDVEQSSRVELTPDTSSTRAGQSIYSLSIFQKIDLE